MRCSFKAAFLSALFVPLLASAMPTHSAESEDAMRAVVAHQTRLLRWARRP